ncbi:MAG: DUF192 domain-containing protein [Proteobacteria bacterium]|nr:DUF192 domain-containing protein [Pseudomonadota bacterium]
MTAGKLISKSGQVTVDPCLRTSNAWDRMRGLLFRNAPVPGAGLLIDPCAAVHTMPMSYPIDVTYLDAEFRIVKRVKKLQRWRLSACRLAKMTLELAAGQAHNLNLRPALELRWQSV